ncbi:MAG TPA: substrate-binding domain-containing protein [Casimicrobiaceae bacterium]
MLKVKLDANLRVGRDTLYAVPPELLGLLRAIERHGSLLHAIKEAGVSYRHAWGLLGRWEAITGHKLAILTRGQGTGLTPFGERLAGIGAWLEPRVAQRFRDLDAELARYLAVPTELHRERVQIHASHDIALLKLKERLDGRLAIDLRFEGSLNSLDSLARGDCDIAGFHLPDPPMLLGGLLEEFSARLNARDHYVAMLLSRRQGLILPKATAKRVRELNDLPRLGMQFVNRERGSGTRLLFDALLARDGVPPAAIKGYEHEEFTHMATAATVRAGMADATFGIEAAAREHGLGFVHVVTEHYYFACRRNGPARIALDTLIATARSSAFARTIARIGGYEISSAGHKTGVRELFPSTPRPSASRAARRR